MVGTSSPSCLELLPGLPDGLLDELVRDLPGRVLVEHGVHQRDLGGAAPRLRLRGAVLENGEREKF